MRSDLINTLTGSGGEFRRSDLLNIRRRNSLERVADPSAPGFDLQIIYF